MFDSDKNDRIDFAELRVALKALGFDVKKDEVKEIMKEFDPEDTGGISFQDFQDLSKLKSDSQIRRKRPTRRNKNGL